MIGCMECLGFILILLKPLGVFCYNKTFYNLFNLMRATLYQNRHKTKKTTQLLPSWLSFVLALLAGASFIFALAPYRLWGVAILSPMILYALLLLNQSNHLKEDAKRAFGIGWVYGFGTWVVGAFWLYTSIHVYGGVSAWLALIMIGLMAFVMGLFHALMAWVFVRFLGRQPLAFAAIWVVQEWCKTWVLTGFPWLFVGYAFTDVPMMNGLAPITGVFGISFVVVLLAASLVEVLRQKAGYLLIALALLVVSVGLWLLNPTWVQPTGKRANVSLVQGNIPQDIKWLTEFQEETLKIYADLSKDEWQQDMVVWPEGAITLFQDEIADLLDGADAYGKQQNTTFITGIPYRDLANYRPDVDDYPPFYNSVLAIGNSTGIYKKQNLVPFGEYIPFAGKLDILPNLAGNQAVLSHSPGEKNQSPIAIKLGEQTHPMGVAICYEVAYPETTRQNAKDSEFLLTVSNDAWFGTSAGPHQHLQMVQMRSLETGRWFARGTNTGVTAIIDDKGRIVAQAPQFVRTVLRGEVAMMIGQTPYVRFGVYPLLVVVFLLLGLSAYAGGRRGQYFAKDGKYQQDYH